MKVLSLSHDHQECLQRLVLYSGAGVLGKWVRYICRNVCKSYEKNQKQRSKANGGHAGIKGMKKRHKEITHMQSIFQGVNNVLWRKQKMNQLRYPITPFTRIC